MSEARVNLSVLEYDDLETSASFKVGVPIRVDSVEVSPQETMELSYAKPSVSLSLISECPDCQWLTEDPDVAAFFEDQ